MIRTDNQLREKLEELSKLDAPRLRAEWASIFGRPAPSRVSRDILIRGIAYRLQEQTYGGLKTSSLKRLKRLAAGLRDESPATAKPNNALRPGTRLLREWQGETQIVEVLAEGFAWRGDKYRSLSGVARAITGTNWSGPNFFGLRDKRDNEPIDAKDLAAKLR